MNKLFTLNIFLKHLLIVLTTHAIGSLLFGIQIMRSIMNPSHSDGSDSPNWLRNQPSAHLGGNTYIHMQKEKVIEIKLPLTQAQIETVIKILRIGRDIKIIFKK